MLQCKVISLYFAVSYTASDVGVFKLGRCFKARGQNANLATYLNPIFYVLWLLKTSNI